MLVFKKWDKIRLIEYTNVQFSKVNTTILRIFSLSLSLYIYIYIYTHTHTCVYICMYVCMYWTSQVVLVVKNMPVKTRDIRCSFDSWVEAIPPGGEHGNTLQYSCLENPWTEKSGGLQSIGLQRIEHDWSDLAHVYTYIYICVYTHMYIYLHPQVSIYLNTHMCIYLYVHT